MVLVLILFTNGVVRKYPSLDCAPMDENMAKLAKIYGALEKHSIAKIPVLTAEDETAIRKVVTFDQKRDTLIGFCGEKKKMALNTNV